MKYLEQVLLSPRVVEAANALMEARALETEAITMRKSAERGLEVAIWEAQRVASNRIAFLESFVADRWSCQEFV